MRDFESQSLRKYRCPKGHVQAETIGESGFFRKPDYCEQCFAEWLVATFPITEKI